MNRPFDAIVIGAGAAGLFCASVAGQRGLRVAVLDHFPRLAEKIRISGGGRCNFTNLSADRPDRFVGEQPRFARDALRAYPPARFIRLLCEHGVGYHEKHRGQLFCDDSSERIIELLRGECEAGGVQWLRPCQVDAVVHREPPGGGNGSSSIGNAHCRYEVHTQAGILRTHELVVATGGLSIPKIGASDFGYKLARQFGLRVVEPRPALVPLTFSGESWAPFAELAGVALPVVASAPANAAAPAFDEDLLFTHRGLSGPAVLQISTFWRHGDPIAIDLAGGSDLAGRLIAAKANSKQTLSAALAAELPRRLAARWLELFEPALAARRLAEIGHRELAALAQRLRDWRVMPNGTEGFRKAEVTVGGVATEGLDPRTMRAQRQPGLYFIGEVVDITGWLGGYNFQWAWASGFMAGQALGRG
ncbi:MAG: NAD(P)/FAD-dependent oxidoreductase [Burkholderiales bacterium]|nr:NAD(P)/FAD-dependent oxidoreductase [Burkholderiales bacterium]